MRVIFEGFNMRPIAGFRPAIFGGGSKLLSPFFATYKQMTVQSGEPSLDHTIQVPVRTC